MSDEAEKPMTDEEVKADSKRRMDAAIATLREMFAVRRMTSDHPAHRLAFALMEDAMTPGNNVGMAKKKYREGTDEDMRRDAAGVIQLMQMMTSKMAQVVTMESAKLGDKFVAVVDVEDEYNCGNPDCPIHGTNAAKPGDILRPDQLTMLPPAIAEGFGKLIEQGLIVRHIGKHGPFGAIEMHGPKHLLKQADEIMAQAGTHVQVDLPAGIAKELDREPQDAHTKEISDALDRAFGRDRTHLPKKDIPLS